MNKHATVRTGILGAGAGILGLRSWRHYRRDRQATLNRLEGVSTVIETRSGELEYAVSGEGAPVMVIHGAPGGFDQGIFMSRILGDKYRWIAVSRFGYLRTPLPAEPSPEGQADAFAALLDELGINHTAVVGISAGGISALQFALRYPDRCTALVLVSAVTGTYPIQIPLLDGSLKLAFRSDYVDWLLIRTLRTPIYSFLGNKGKVKDGLTPEYREWLSEFIDTFMPLRMRCDGLLNDRHTLPRIKPYPLGRIQAPVLIIHAADDPAVPLRHANNAAHKIPDAHLLILEDGGHLLIGRHEEAKKATMEFLNRHLDSSG